MKTYLADEIFKLIGYGLESSLNKPDNEAFKAPLQTFSPSQDAVRYISEQQLDGFFYAKADELPILSGSREQMAKRSMYSHIMQATLRAITDEAEKKGIPFAVLKGEVLQACYPTGCIRPSGDIDVYVPQAYRVEFCRMLEAINASTPLNDDRKQTGVDDYYFKNGVHLEVHYLFAVQFSEECRKNLKESGIFDAENFIKVNSGCGLIPSLRPEHHLFYLIYHLVKHLMFAEAGVFRMFADIAMFVNRYGSEIETSVLWKLLKENGLSEIANTIFYICREKLGMSSEFIEISEDDVHYEKLISMIPENHGLPQMLKERVLWTAYKCRIKTDSDGTCESYIREDHLIMVLFFPIILKHCSLKRFWKINSVL